MQYPTTTYLSASGERVAVEPPHSHQFSLAVAAVIERAQAKGMAAEAPPEPNRRVARTGRVTEVLGEMIIVTEHEGILTSGRVREDRTELHYWANEHCDPRVPLEASVFRRIIYGGGVRLARNVQTGPGYLTDTWWASYMDRRHTIGLWPVVGAEIDQAVAMVQAGVPNVDYLPVGVISAVVRGLDNPRLHGEERQRLHEWGAELIAQQPAERRR